MERKPEEMKENKGGALRPLELYVHIPFCVRKCLYCDFLSAPSDEKTRETYLQALLAEIEGVAAQYRDRTVTTVFLGGGTPSLLEGEQAERLFACIRNNFSLDENAEITMEANPGTVDQKKLAAYRRAGVNRLSIGLQSADNGELAAIGRIHTWEDFLETWRMAEEAGFCNVNVDLMSALPGQSPESYRETLRKVLSLEPRPKHISAYSLIVEEGTPFYEMYSQGRLSLPDEETDRLMYRDTKQMLKEQGYERYEISNYALSGFACRHNCGYWKRENYLGFGIGAASLVDNVRWRNKDSLREYLLHPTGCREEIQRLDRKEQMEEFMFLGLRMAEGVDARRFEELFGERPDAVYRDVIEKNKKDGLLVRDEGSGDRIFLTERGLDLSNYVMAQFLL